ncbi:MAG: hypothetical protein CMM07_03625 [Rhodopirellula sp.]|nr:hypothetical protein [Rhodopirellula sp.]
MFILGNELDEDALFRRALMIPAAKQRSKFLDQACGSDSGLRSRVGRLLEADESDWLQFDGLLEDDTVSEVACTQLPVIDNYHLVEKIGAGGMADVFVANQLTPFEREVAVKIQRAQKIELEAFPRFQFEVQTLAKLEHENIATIYDAGTTADGHPYVSMELVRGEPITRFCNDHRLNIADRIRLFIEVCNGIEYAHHHGVIHRDLKPANILVAENLLGPVPKIIDFGLAKDTEGLGGQCQPQDRQIIGSLNYMSPEQFRLDFDAVDAHTDVFALGVILHEMIVGEIPLSRELSLTKTLEERVRCVCEVVPVSIGSTLKNLQDREEFSESRSTSFDQLTKQFTPTLDKIVARMLAKREEERYSTIRELSDDLQRFLNGGELGKKTTDTGVGVGWYQRRFSLLVFSLLLVVASAVAAIKHRQTQVEFEPNPEQDLGFVVPNGGGVGPALGAVGISSGGRGNDALLDFNQPRSLELGNEGSVPGSREEFYYLVHDMRPVAAWLLAEAWQDDPKLEQLRDELGKDFDLAGLPDGAEVEICDWNTEPFQWHRVELRDAVARLPLGDVFIEPLRKRFVPSLRMRVKCAGYVTKELVLSAGEFAAMGGKIKLVKKTNDTPPGMTRVFGVADALEMPRYRSYGGFREGDFWVDKLEVSNKEYLEFVEAGAYESADHWSSVEFRMDEEVQPFKTAMKRFVDRTGKPGPASWVDGRFPDGKEMYPVSGISFFEAAAYARFRGKRLLTILEWRQAVLGRAKSALVARSNYASEGPARCGAHAGISRFDIRDLGGNVREWCSTVDQHGRGYILGGSWEDPRHAINLNIAVDRWNRDLVNGIRCCKGASETEEELTAGRQSDDFTSSMGVSPGVSLASLEDLNKLHKYARGNPPDATVEQVDNPALANLGVSYTIARQKSGYDQTRCTLHLFRPAETEDPLSSVMLLADLQEFSGISKVGLSLALPESDSLAAICEILKRNKILLCIPELRNREVIQGTGGRTDKLNTGGKNTGDQPASINRVNNAMWGLDYVASQGDLVSGQTCLLAFGATGEDAVRLLALDDRLQTGVLVATGYKKQSKLGLRFRDISRKTFGAYHYAPRVTQPVLMINGSLDLEYPELTCQLPLFNEVGSSVKERLQIGGSLLHEPQHLNEVLVHVVDWFMKNP